MPRAILLRATEGELNVSVDSSQMASASEVVARMLTRLTDADSACSLDLPPGSTVALIVNNLGGLSVMEQYIVAGELIKQLGL